MGAAAPILFNIIKREQIGYLRCEAVFEGTEHFNIIWHVQRQLFGHFELAHVFIWVMDSYSFSPSRTPPDLWYAQCHTGKAEQLVGRGTAMVA
jgi:hypothetical protein